LAVTGSNANGFIETSRRLSCHAQRLHARQGTATTRLDSRGIARSAAIFEILGRIVASDRSQVFRWHQFHAWKLQYLSSFSFYLSSFSFLKTQVGLPEHKSNAQLTLDLGTSETL
jgi:hypothetical protein